MSLKAKGLLAQLLSHTESWKITIKSLCMYNKEGRKAIEGAIRELIVEGYLIQRKYRDEGGKYDVEYYVSDRKSDLTDVPFPPRLDRCGLSDAENVQRSIHINKNINQEEQKRILSSMEQFFIGMQDAGVRMSYLKEFFKSIDDDDYEFVFERLKEILEKSKCAEKRAAYIATSLENLKEEMKSAEYRKQKSEIRRKEKERTRREEKEKERKEMMIRGKEIYDKLKIEERKEKCEDIFVELDENEKKRLEIFGKNVETLPETLRNTIFIKLYEKFNEDELESSNV
jgi:hypothetical protein